jgi:putative nucleotidyltransferase with HDIG domain
MNAKVNGGDSPIIVGPVTNPLAVAAGQHIDGLFRFGCGYARLAKDGRHAWVMDLYQRKAILTGKALACDIPKCPQADSVVRVKGQIIGSDGGVFLWVRELAPEIGVSTDVCALDLATPSWVVDQGMVDALSDIWSTLVPPYRELINAVLSDAVVLKGFLQAPGSVRHHDAVTGGCVDHTVRAARMALAIAELTPELDRDMLVAGAILHDIGKSIEYCLNDYGRWGMSRFGKRVGHKVGGALIVGMAAKQCQLLSSEKLEDLLHMMTSSYAPTWAGYRLPATMEAMALSAIDRLCAGRVSVH